jgi:DNA invertase Pin-like site-specific DNA recombinase
MLDFHMLCAIAEFERALIRERTAAGLAEAKRKGKTGGRPRRLTEKDVRAEFSLTALVYNLRRALNILGVEAMMAAARG